MSGESGEGEEKVAPELIGVINIHLWRRSDGTVAWSAASMVKVDDPNAEDENIRRAVLEAAAAFKLVNN